VRGVIRSALGAPPLPCCPPTTYWRGAFSFGRSAGFGRRELIAPQLVAVQLGTLLMAGSALECSAAPLVVLPSHDLVASGSTAPGGMTSAAGAGENKTTHDRLRSWRARRAGGRPACRLPVLLFFLAWRGRGP
jgi:hypothetical protein